MDILSQVFVSNEDTKLFKEKLFSKVEEFISPIVYNPSAYNYGEFISSLGYFVHSFAREVIVEMINDMDAHFFNLKERKDRYYSKAYRKREIITVFGHIVYFRHEYVNRSNNKPFIYVDEKLGLRRRDRYDPIVCSLIYEKYSYTNSMAKVGRDIGVSLSSPFSLNEERLLDSIPRQTVWKILHRFKKIDLPYEENDTPFNIYIMADEKYIPSQLNNHTKLMCKEIIVHEGIKPVITSVNKETGEVYTRNKIINPRKILSYEEDIYDKALDYICNTYDIDKIKNVYIMGDGGSWIENGISKISSYAYNTSYGLDKFHLCLAVNTISKNEEDKSLLYEHSINNDKKEFKECVKSIIEKDPNREKIINEKAKYILNHFKAINVMYKDIKIGCAMEQAISHDIMSQFTSVPKAYSSKWLPYYLNQRENYLNNYDLRKIYLKAIDKIDTDDNEGVCVQLKEHLNTSFFDSQIKEEYYKLPKSAAIALSRHKY